MRDPILLIHSKTFIESYIFCLIPGDERKTKNVWAGRTPLESLHSERNTMVPTMICALTYGDDKHR